MSKAIYLARIPDGEFSLCESLLSEYRKRRVVTPNRAVRKRSLCAEALLIAAIREFKPSLAAPFDIVENGYGKPYLKDNGICFSLSHSQNMVLCALCDHEIGADVQITTGANDALIHRFFAPSEIEAIGRAVNRDEVFTEIWSKKESYIKAVGKGLVMPLPGLSVTEEPLSSLIVHGREGAYHYALCDLYGDHAEPVCRWIDLESFADQAAE